MARSLRPSCPGSSPQSAHRRRKPARPVPPSPPDARPGPGLALAGALPLALALAGGPGPGALSMSLAATPRRRRLVSGKSLTPANPLRTWHETGALAAGFRQRRSGSRHGPGRRGSLSLPASCCYQRRGAGAGTLRHRQNARDRAGARYWRGSAASRDAAPGGGAGPIGRAVPGGVC